MTTPPVAVPLATTTAVNYRHTCQSCGAVMIGRYPGDLIQAMDRHGLLGLDGGARDRSRARHDCL